MVTILISLFFLLQSTLNPVHCVIPDLPTSVPIANCSGFKDCSTCLQNFDCVWCADPRHENENSTTHHTFQRCQTREEMKTAGCDGFLQNFTSRLIVNEEQPTKCCDKTNKDDDILISPQSITLELRANDPKTFKMEYQDPGDKPLDLYYLMDLSHTMNNYRALVAEQAQGLANALKNLTGNLALGFGSFIDKPIVPFASKIQLDGKFVAGGSTTVVPYSFKNHLPLQTVVSAFKDAVSRTKASANFDNPEGTLDALMQVMACKGEIGWRNNSRRLVVVSTDGPFHIAGDGRLLGILTPNDLQCHTENGTHTHYDKLDYPSIAQINKKAKEENVFLVFAVVGGQLPLYKQLARRIQGANAVELTKESDNVVQIISSEYQKIKSTLLIRQEPTRIEGLEITYTFICDNQTKQNSSGSAECQITAEAKKEFYITVKLTDCAKFEKHGFRKVEIFPTTDRHQTLVLHIKPKCHCNCEEKKEVEEVAENPTDGLTEDSTATTETTQLPSPNKDPLCNHRGSIKCGQCECTGDYSGRNCQCDNNSPMDINTKKCIRPGTDVKCSGRGKCHCGQCQCNLDDAGLPYWGVYCENGNQDCMNEARGAVCSGKGSCYQGGCQCNDGYEGKLCQCLKDPSPCKEPGEGTKPCNDRARCECPKVSPNQTSAVSPRCHDCANGYEGQYCHISPGSGTGTECGDPNMKKCVDCIVANNGISPPNPEIPSVCNSLCMGKQTNRSVTFSVEIVQQYTNNTEYARCDRKLQDGCTVRYVYQFEGESIKVQLLQRQESDCPKTPWWIIYVVVGSIVLIGILTLLIWKVATHIHDTREFERFKQACDEGNWAKGENPLYVTASTTVQNPAFRGDRAGQVQTSSQ